MSSDKLHIRPAHPADLEAINRVIESAVMSWNLPERVKRLSLSSYRYNDIDVQHLDMVVAEDEQKHVIGVAAWENADPKDTPDQKPALLLHGIYVSTRLQRKNIGTQLFHWAEVAAQKQHCDGLLVKAQKDAVAFFLAMGMKKLQQEDHRRQFANRFWKSLR
ncbi:MAG: GNAT family N-acetyltransferase [Gammaproteobacteria bacterium]|nr:GNAT family N-acetyltransferase [Gammaproteobacteria bacterium]MDH5803414.1 GNAT family N-acetyltransferase [Gammaproteobacteria bacterium]